MDEAYPGIGKLSTELDKAQKERDQAALDRNQAASERDKAALDRDQVALERDKTVLERDSGFLKAELEQTQMVQETTANWNLSDCREDSRKWGATNNVK